MISRIFNFFNILISRIFLGTIPGLEIPANPEPVKEEPKEPEVAPVKPEKTKTEKSASPEKVINWDASMKKTKAITAVILMSHDLSIKT